MAKPIPDGYSSIQAYFTVEAGKGLEAMDWYIKALGGESREKIMSPDGSMFMHGEVQIGNSILMLGEAKEQHGSKCPKALGGTPVGVYVYVEDVDARFKKAIDAGATEKMAVVDMFWGDRMGSFVDPFGHEWTVATHTKDMTEAEIAAAAAAMFGG